MAEGLEFPNISEPMWGPKGEITKYSSVFHQMG
jgi:hypothetical protein